MNQDAAVARLKALAHPVRLRILDLLAQEELSVGELTEILGMAQSRVSGHLGVLRESALVRDRRQGTSAFYSPVAEGEGRATWDAIRGTLSEPVGRIEDRRRLAETLARRRERGREFFDRVAARWDEGRSESLGLHAGVFALAGLLPPETVVLDLGTGTGGLLPLLGSYVDGVVAVDLSRAMLERARERLGPRGAGVGLLRADVEHLPLGDATVDGVVANMILHHLPHPGNLLREVARILRRGGRAVVVDFEPHDERWLMEEEGHRWAGFDPAQLGGWCLDAGLTVPEFQRVPTPEGGRWSRLEVFAARLGRGRELE
jgi:ArsR family transcriptional regulator